MHAAGAEMVAISVDDDIRQAGMTRRWGLPAFRFVSDPGGETFLQAMSLFDPEERGGIALPGMVIISPAGEEVYRYQGRDFADRTNDDDLFAALSGLGLPAIDPDPWVPDVEPPEDLGRFFAPAMVGPYFRGNMFGATAIARRISDDESRAIAHEHRVMAKSTLDAWEVWRQTL